ncbi:LysR family transcriptional regulator [Rhizobium sp. SSA_523]|uniref:LysR family transcriptional regulator n=1 Tax=Rhizobium sp. SSA_523 TaxID=2952477 RepID=UPI0020915082|nr:LysR family transcriptional regulator [Rhizobium sp. SSA_523]MCO5730558.1 LysR family transcriptional regulator [Rhizobium sp. SSA_523]WKC25595.1 LysR family transcriptional regulator [Rhizobium sp. SSA_523]
MHISAVAEHLNFRHAANALGTTQSSISARIKALEETLGILLFKRRHCGVGLTEAGRLFVSEVATGIGHLDHAIRTAGAISSGTTGQLATGLISSITGGFIADLRTRFHIEFPDVDQVVVEGPSAQTVAMVRDGKLDVALVPTLLAWLGSTIIHDIKGWNWTLTAAFARSMVACCCSIRPMPHA